MALLAVGIYACKKETETPQTNDPPAPTVDIDLKNISAKPWVMYKAELAGINIWNSGMIPDCQKDDLYRFYKDSTLMTYENTKKCSGNTDSTESSWMFYNNKKQIIGTILGIEDTADVVTLNETTLNLSIDYQGSPVKLYFKNN